MYMVGLLTITLSLFVFVFFNDTATTEIYTLSLHDALPISSSDNFTGRRPPGSHICQPDGHKDRKSTRLNSSHRCISYAVFCLKKTVRIRRFLEPSGTSQAPCPFLPMKQMNAGQSRPLGQHDIEIQSNRQACHFFKHPRATELCFLSLTAALPD